MWGHLYRQAISNHKILTRLARGSRKVKMPQKWYRSPPEAPKRIKEMDPKWSTQLPLIGLSPFPGPLTRLGASRELRSQIEAISGADFDLP